MHSSIYIHSFAVCLTCSLCTRPTCLDKAPSRMTLSFPLVCLHPSLCLPPSPRSATPECVCARRGPRPRAYVLSDCPASTYKETSTLRTSCARSAVRDPVFFLPKRRRRYRRVPPTSMAAVGAGVRVYCRLLSRVAHRVCWLRLSSSGSSMYPVWCIPMMVIPVLSVDDMRLATGRFLWVCRL